MDFYEEASLVMVPSGYKDQKVYSSVPDDGSADLTFSRASTATRINSDGYIEKAQVNLLLQSNSFDTTWTNSSTTETSGQSGYDGTNDAWKLTKSAINAYIRQDLTGSGVFTFSVYAKASTDGGDSDGIYMLINGSPDSWATFDLNNGTTSLGAGASVDSKIEVIGSGWYRCSLTASGGVSDVRIYPTAQDGTRDDTTGAVFIQDAQLNYGLVAQTYVETTTASVTEGVAIDVPRLTYDPVNPTSASLLLEPSRQNLMPSSEDIDNLWSKLRVTVENNSTTSPEGLVNAGKSIVTADDGNHASYDTISSGLTGGNPYFISCFVKKVNTKYIRLYEGYTSAYVEFNFDDQTTDLQNGASDLLLEQHPNGWWRLGFKFTADASGNGQFALYINDNNNNRSYIGAGEAVYLWGAQIEAGSYPTSYIPTYGASSTRTSEFASKAGIASLIGQSEGTLFVELEDTDNFQAYIGVDNGSTGYRIIIYGTLDNKVYTQIRHNVSVIFSSQSAAISGRAKAAVSFNASGSVFYVNGVQVGSGSGITYPNNLVQLTMNHSSQVGSKVNQALLFKTRLSNASLSELTTL